MPHNASTPVAHTNDRNYDDRTQDKAKPMQEELQAQLLSDILRDNNVYLGGSSLARGFRRAARYYLRKRAPRMVANHRSRMMAQQQPVASAVMLDTSALNAGVDLKVEDAFHVVDLGVIVSQYYQWRRHFPRVDVFYAVKCNPDPVIIKTLAALGCHFDCASRTEIRLVQEVAGELPPPLNRPEIVYANPTKGRSHVIEAVCRGVTLMTFDNVEEVRKCAAVSNQIRLLLRIVTDDSGSQCRLSSKYGAAKSQWRTLLSTAKECRLEVVGVAFHVGSGCRDESRYELALRDARELFDLAAGEEFGFEMSILDIGGGFPGETHSLWNPVDVFGDPTAPDADVPPCLHKKYSIDDEISGDEVESADEGYKTSSQREKENAHSSERPLVFFADIAKAVAPVLDELFPPESGVQIMAEPGRYLVAASATLVASIIGVRSNAVHEMASPTGFSDERAAKNVDQITRAEEDEIIGIRRNYQDQIADTITDELADFSKLSTQINLSQQEIDVYTDRADFIKGGLGVANSLLAPPTDRLSNGEKLHQHHTVEGMHVGIVKGCYDDKIPSSVRGDPSAGNAMMTLASAGEAAISGITKQVVADSVEFCDDYAYYINDGVYGAFNNLIFDHSVVRPRHLKSAISTSHQIVEVETTDGLTALEAVENDSLNDNGGTNGGTQDDSLYPSTVFGPTCDSIDVVARSVLLPKLSIGDWLYFQNMGAYTSAAASSFNGFLPTEKFYVCSVQPEHFEKLVQGPIGVVASKEETALHGK